MEKASNIFIKIDDFIFKKLDLLKNDGVFQKFNDGLSNLEESQQKLVAQLTTFAFILLPFIFVLVLWWGNSQTKKTLDIKKQIIEQIALYEGNQSALTNISTNYLSPTAISSQEDLDNRIRNILSQNAIDQEKVTVSNFHSTSTSSTVAKVEADLNFRNFGTNDFSSFMRTLVERERLKIIKVDLTKNQENNLLQGTISLMHMGQNAITPEL
ncbi:hypothetical protein SHI21_16950 [Bacteriovorax sp. PP10]|uniref:Uncharacterized protein n=1 Tax=Bacteriovorax antarcticus TaxID=3088717 RepID=A0ABU5VXY7_9BACT|nr:hypothetical protein [Bacteriovorax sp. PP10]MEA9357922.1 hypothetical protein [Bacteriovorax sp. PP10]